MLKIHESQKQTVKQILQTNNKELMDSLMRNGKGIGTFQKYEICIYIKMYAIYMALSNLTGLYIQFHMTDKKRLFQILHMFMLKSAWF